MTTATPLLADFAVVGAALLESAGAFLARTAPVRRYLSWGTPVADFGVCEQLVLYPSMLTAGLPGAPSSGQYDRTANFLRSYGLTLELMRCVPTPDGQTLITQAALNASGVQLFSDFQQLDLWVRSLGFNSKTDPALRDLGMQSVAPGTVMPVNPQGGMAGVRATFTITI